ncbi:6-phosphofructokinase [bacterium]|nr:6-phosphofructokinase [bacterium]
MRIGVLTSGGDAPGMNAAIRAVVRSAIYYGASVVGIRRGYLGLMEGLFVPLDSHSVGGIINRGGTILETARAEDFKRKEMQKLAVENLEKNDIDALIVIGGNGTFKGALALHKEWGVPLNQVASTIDNDLPGTDVTVGFDTAVNTALEIIDRIRDTAVSFERIFVVEVMGRDRGFIALEVGIAGGAEYIIIPEVPLEFGKLVRKIEEGKMKGKRSCVIVLAEGAGKAEELAKRIREETGLETRGSVVGYAQRGGCPTAKDRVLATVFGAEAVRLAMEGKYGYLIGMREGKVSAVPLKELEGKTKEIDLTKLQIAGILSI